MDAVSGHLAGGIRLLVCAALALVISGLTNQTIVRSAVPAGATSLLTSTVAPPTLSMRR